MKHRNAYPKAPIFLPKTPHSCVRVRRFFLIPPQFCFGCARETAVSSAKTDEIGGRRRSLPPISEYHFSAGNHRTGLSSSPFRGLVRRQAAAQDERGGTSRGSPCCGKFSPAVSCPRANLIRRAPIRSQKIRAKRCRTGKVGAQKPFRVQKWPFHRRATRANSFRTSPAFRSSPVCTPHKG